ncbi:MAG: sugar phosphate isomerase/epimerase [Victivallales bacterium]|nr:sugar phosphate isomerase/epimerase [Victivallales bacterium]
MMNIVPPVSYNFGASTPVELIQSRLENLRAAGAKRVMLDASQLMLAADDPQYRKALMEGLSASGLTLFDVHAPHGVMDSFGCPIPGAEAHFLETARKSIHTAAELGAQTITFHCSRTRLVKNMAPPSGPIEDVNLSGAKSRILHELDILLPEAEKCQMMIALENLFLPSSTALFLTSVIKEMQHPLLGLNYDSGHALLLEHQTGKEPSDIAAWIQIGWADDKVEFQPDQLDEMLNYMITAHLHDNHGKADEHLMPGDGIADWPHIIQRLKTAPRLLSLQSEVSAKCYLEDPGCQVRAFQNVGFK